MTYLLLFAPAALSVVVIAAIQVYSEMRGDKTNL